MPDLIVTLTAPQLTRLRAALGRPGAPATIADVQAEVRQYLKGRVVLSEQRAAENTAQATVLADLTAEGW